MTKLTEKELEYHRKYNIKNRDKIRKRRRKHYLENKERLIEYNRKFYNSPVGRFKSYKLNAKNRGIDFTLSFQEFCDFIGIRCFYCGRDTNIVGIDRVNNDIGYTKENCVSCCKRCNMAKGKNTQQEFIEMCRFITENRNK